MTIYHVAFWNLENLFAPEGFAGREPWIEEKVGRDLVGWTEALLDTKLSQLAEVIAWMNDGAGPDVLGFAEVENHHVVARLIEALQPLLPDRVYRVVHFDSSKDKRGIDTGFLYDAERLAVDDEAIFSHIVMRRTGTRDITQVTFATRSGRELVAFSNHWPSRSGGHHSESAGFRAVAGETLAYWHERVREIKGEDVAVVAMGDFNDDPGDASLVYNARATRERDDVAHARTARLYNTAWEHLAQVVTTRDGGTRTIYGTLYWDGNGNVFDQILLSPSIVRSTGAFGLVPGSPRIEAFPHMVSPSKNAGPIRFGLPKGGRGTVDETGYSDHFPVSVKLVEA